MRVVVVGIPCSSGTACIDSIHANSNAQQKYSFQILCEPFKKRSTALITELRCIIDARRFVRHSTRQASRILDMARMYDKAGTYPVQEYLKSIGRSKYPVCPHCPESVPESLKRPAPPGGDRRVDYQTYCCCCRS